MKNRAWRGALLIKPPNRWVFCAQHYIYIQGGIYNNHINHSVDCSGI